MNDRIELINKFMSLPPYLQSVVRVLAVYKLEGGKNALPKTKALDLIVKKTQLKRSTAWMYLKRLTCDGSDFEDTYSPHFIESLNGDIIIHEKNIPHLIFPNKINLYLSLMCCFVFALFGIILPLMSFTFWVLLLLPAPFFAFQYYLTLRQLSLAK